MFFEIYKSGSQYRWRLKAGNNQIIADSGGELLEQEGLSRRDQPRQVH